METFLKNEHTPSLDLDYKIEVISFLTHIFLIKF